MSFVEFMMDNRSEVLRLTMEHMLLVGLSTGIASAVGIPAGILLSRVPRARGPVLGMANVFQAIPSLALLGFLLSLPLIGGIGARPAIVALVVYALMPIIKNTYTGIMGVDSSIRDAARGIGMTDGQILRMVEIPLAMPVILTGVRIATVIGVGVATIAAAIGAGGLGEYIFRGVAMVNHNVILAGAVPAAMLALLADGGLHLIEKRLDRRGA